MDTTHGCWNGPYSAFMRWRSELHYWLTADPDGRDGYENAIRSGEPVYYWADAPLPLRDTLEKFRGQLEAPMRAFMTHSDCDGEIAAEDCGPLADALQIIIDVCMPPRAMYDIGKPATERFIEGLRAAAAAGEAVEFR